MKVFKKICGYKPSNKDSILEFVFSSKLFSAHESVGNGGISTFQKYGTLHKQYPEIFGEFSRFLLKSLDGKYSIMDMWMNIYPKGSFVKAHHHYNYNYPGALAGVYYFKKPENSGNLVIEKEEIPVKENDLVLFSSKKMHWTKPNESDEYRIILSFNLIPVE